MPSPTSLVVKNGSKILSRCSGGMPGPLSRTTQQARAVFHPAFDPDGGLLAVGERLALQGIEGVLQQVDQHLDELVLVGPDGLVLRPASARCAPCPSTRCSGSAARTCTTSATSTWSQLLGVGMRERAQIGDDVLDPVDALLDVLEDVRRIRACCSGARCLPFLRRVNRPVVAKLSGLLISWMMPALMRPSEASFSDCTSCVSVSLSCSMVDSSAWFCWASLRW